MEDMTGVQPSLNDQEIQDYLKEVIREVKRWDYYKGAVSTCDPISVI